MGTEKRLLNIYPVSRDIIILL